VVLRANRGRGVSDFQRGGSPWGRRRRLGGGRGGGGGGGGLPRGRGSRLRVVPAAGGERCERRRSCGCRCPSDAIHGSSAARAYAPGPRLAPAHGGPLPPGSRPLAGGRGPVGAA